MPYILGHANVTSLVVPWSSIVGNTELLVMFGGAHMKNTQVGSGGTATHDDADWLAPGSRSEDRRVQHRSGAEQRQRRARSDVGAHSAQHRYGADARGSRIASSREGAHDRAFLAQYCAGYPRFERYLLGSDDGVREKMLRGPPRSPAQTQTRFARVARRMATHRTLITTTWSIQRADHGEQPVWMTITLAAMLGQIGLPGGGFSLGFVCRQRHRPRGRRAEFRARRCRSVRTRSRRSFRSDASPICLLHPNSEIDFDGKRIRLPETKLVYSVGGNPFHHNSNPQPLSRCVAAARYGDRARTMVESAGEIRRHRVAGDDDDGTQRYPRRRSRTALHRDAPSDCAGRAVAQRLRHFQRSRGAPRIRRCIHRGAR